MFSIFLLTQTECVVDIKYS